MSLNIHFTDENEFVSKDLYFGMKLYVAINHVVRFDNLFEAA